MAAEDTEPLSQKREFKVGTHDVTITTLKSKDEKNTIIDVTIDYLNGKRHVFRDEFVLSHTAEPFLQNVVDTLYTCFGDEAVKHKFISYDEQSKSFSFQFESANATASHTLPVIRTVSLSRSEFTEQEAIQRVISDNDKLLSSSPNKHRVHCINSHVVDDTTWCIEVELSLRPGICSLCYLYFVHDFHVVHDVQGCLSYLVISMYITGVSDFVNHHLSLSPQTKMFTNSSTLRSLRKLRFTFMISVGSEISMI